MWQRRWNNKWRRSRWIEQYIILYCIYIYIHRSLFDFWIVLFYLFNGASYKSSKKTTPLRLLGLPMSSSPASRHFHLSPSWNRRAWAWNLGTSICGSPEKKTYGFDLISRWWLMWCNNMCNNQLEKYESMGFGWHPIYEMENIEFYGIKTNRMECLPIYEMECLECLPNRIFRFQSPPTSWFYVDIKTFSFMKSQDQPAVSGLSG